MREEDGRIIFSGHILGHIGGQASGAPQLPANVMKVDIMGCGMGVVSNIHDNRGRDGVDAKITNCLQLTRGFETHNPQLLPISLFDSILLHEQQEQLALLSDVA